MESCLRAILRPVDLVYFASKQTGGEERPQRGERSPGDASAGGLSLFCELTLRAGRQETAKTGGRPARLPVGHLPAKDEHTSP